MNKYTISLGGGLGDVFQHMMRDDGYGQLMNMGPEDFCDIWLVCHNPFIQELFAHHPKKDQFKVVWPGYFGPQVDAQERLRWGVSDRDSLPPGNRGKVQFYPSAEDYAVLNSLGDKRLVVLSPTAGTGDRSISDAVVQAMIQDLKAKDVQIVGAGRNYVREGRKEFDYSAYPEVISVVDRLSIPGTIELINRSYAVISSHSAVCLMAWWARKRHLLVLPKCISWVNNMDKGENNEYTFGLFYPENQLVYTEEYSKENIAKLLK